MKIGIFGGSFNPIHKGHIKIARYAIKELNLDKIIFVPCQRNPFKKDSFYEDGNKRAEMIKMVLEEKMSISTFEIDRMGNSFTIDTVKYFREKFKNDELFLLIGSDNLTKLSKWKDIDEIAKLVKIAVFKRSKNINKTNIKKFNGTLLNNDIYDESSTIFFEGNFDVVDKKVLNFIGKNKIYFEEILKKMLDEKRYLHSMHAKKFAIKVAKNIGYDPEKAGFAAMVHDIAKYKANNNKTEARKIIEKYEGKERANIEDYMLHQELGYVILKHIFNVEDDIANSVRVHTSLDMNLSIIDKIVFVADKLCQGRKYEGIQKDRKLVLDNFDEGFKKVVEKTRDFNNEKGIEFTEKQRKIYEKWTK